MSLTHRIRSAALAAGLLLACILVAAPAPARQVAATWVEGAANATVTDRAGAVQSAFRTAVFREALDILPGPIDEGRQSLLWDWLAPKAADWVQSYSETRHTTSAPPAPKPAAPVEGEGVAPSPPAAPGPVTHTIELDVQVNRPAVKRALRRLGVYYTTDAPWPFELRLSGGEGDDWQRLGDLQRLSGVVAREGAQPVLNLSHEVDGWQGSLDNDGQTWTAFGADLATVWIDLWGQFFSRPEVESGLVRTTVLVVDGWYTPDGARAFDAVLRGWQKEVEEAQLVGLTVTAEGIEGRWRVKTLDAQALERRLAAYAPDRGLTWRLGH